MRNPWPWVLLVAAIHLGAHLWTAGNYGIFRDEYYYLACARRLAWGYVDQPPFSILVLAVVRELLGVGVLALRLVPALCGAGIVVLAARIAARLGGRAFAQVLAALAIAIAGVVQAITGFYSMNAIDLLLWTSVWWVLAQWLLDGDRRWWPFLGLLMGLGLLNKIGLLVMGAALVVALLATEHRRLLRRREPWVGAAIAFVIFLPHLVWQATHAWPTLEFIENAQRYKISALSPVAFLTEVTLEQHPVNLPLWLVGLGWLLFGRAGRRFRLLGLTVLTAFALLLLQRAKPYYAAGLFPVLFAAGACAWERITARRRLAWLRPVIVVLAVASGLFFLPLGVPVLGVAQLARWQQWTGIAPAAQEVGHTSELPQHYSDRFGWEELAQEVARVVKEMPARERAGVVIFASNYGEAGALEYWAERYALPPVLSGHNNYWMWLPEQLELGTAIVVGYSREDVLESFREVTLAGRLQHAWALQDGTPIWVARGPVLEWTTLRQNLRRYI